MPTMRAKMLVLNVTVNADTDAAGNSVTRSEQLRFAAVGPDRNYNEDGTGDEDNTFSRWTPCANLDITIQNPALFGQFKNGDKFYVDFTPADVAQAAPDALANDAGETGSAGDSDPAEGSNATQG